MSELVLVYQGSLQQADVVKGLLESAGIQAFLDGEHMASTYTVAVDWPGEGPGKVVVSSSVADQARQVIADARVPDDDDAQ